MNFPEIRVKFSSANGPMLDGVAILPIEPATNAPAVMFFHGWGSSASCRPFVELSLALARNGIASFRFSFSGHGESGGDFEKVSITGLCEEADMARDVFLVHPKISHRIDNERIAFIGHSIGALIAVLMHIKHGRKAPLILLNPAINQKELLPQWSSKAELDRGLADGFVDNSKGGMSAEYIEQALNPDDLPEFNWMNRLKLVSGPVLLIHGSPDDKVPWAEFSKVAGLIGDKLADVRIIEDASHKLESRHAKDELIKICVPWLKRNL